MIAKYKQIFNLYYRNTNFMLLSGVLLISAIVSKALYIFGDSSLAEDFSTLLFVATLWLTFYFGLLIKRQFANHRASLLPGYRKPHVHCLMIIYILFVFIAIRWDHGLKPLFEITSNGLQGAYVSCFFAALLITYLGYLSLGRALIYSYVVSLLIAVNATHIIAVFEHFIYLKYIIGIFAGLFIIFFIQRLMNLREHHFEYNTLLTWPPKYYFVNESKLGQFISSSKRFFKAKEEKVNIPMYPRTANIFFRAYHWDYVEHSDIKVMGMLIALMTPIYLLFIKSNPMFAEFFKSTDSNFLLLSITPVLIAMGGHYKKLSYWGHDLLKPISKKQYMKERGVILLAHLFMYWFVFIVCFALLPNIIFQPEVYKSAKFWGFLILTGSFSLLVTAWLVWLSCMLNSKVIILNGLILSVIILFQFYFASVFSLQMIVSVNIIYLCIGIIFLKKAYLAWCQKEFI